MTSQGSFGTECVENRFDRYTQPSESQYDVSMRQMHESEHKLRPQEVLLDVTHLDDISLCHIPLVTFRLLWCDLI